MKLIRQVFAHDYTLGELVVAGEHFQTCEDAVREVVGKPVGDWKIPGQTAIPMGTYRVTITMSNRFKQYLPLLHDVPGFEGIRVHSGNSAQDSSGCVILGLARDEEKGIVTRSRDAMALFMPLLRRELDKGDVYIQVI